MTYAHQVRTKVPTEKWDEAYFSLLSLKAHVQSLPGWIGMQMTAGERGDSTVDVFVSTEWETLDALVTWAQSTRSPDAILRSIGADDPNLDIEVSVAEVLA